MLQLRQVKLKGVVIPIFDGFELGRVKCKASDGSCIADVRGPIYPSWVEKHLTADGDFIEVFGSGEVDFRRS